MSEKIEPALSAEGWEEFLAWAGYWIADEVLTQVWPFTASPDNDALRPSVAVPATIAVANQLLPDSDPRKITREKIQAILDVLGIVPSGPVKAGVEAFAGALESYLPPETR